MAFKWKELHEKLGTISENFEYLAVDDDGFVTVYIGGLDKSDPIPDYTGLNFDHDKVLQKLRKEYTPAVAEEMSNA